MKSILKSKLDGLKAIGTNIYYPKIQTHRKMMSAGLKHIAVHLRDMAFTV